MRDPRDRPAPVPPDRLSRLLVLLHYLLDEERGDDIPIHIVAQDLGMTEEEVAADLRLLNLVNHGGGTYVVYASLENGTVSVSRETLSDAYAKPARLSPQLAKALRLALDMLEDTMAGAGLASLASVREKLEAALDSETDTGRVEIHDSVAADPKVLEVLRQAVADHQVVSLEYYTASRDELRRRAVEPHYLVHGGPAWYLEAFCRGAKGPRTFRVDRIRSAKLIGESFIPREDMPLEPQPARPESWGEARIARVRFSEHRRAYLEEEGLHVEKGPDGWVIAELPFVDEDWLIRHVLSHGGHAVLEEPARLRPAVASQAKELRARYG